MVGYGNLINKKLNNAKNLVYMLVYGNLINKQNMLPIRKYGL